MRSRGPTDEKIFQQQCLLFGVGVCVCVARLVVDVTGSPLSLPRRDPAGVDLFDDDAFFLFFHMQRNRAIST